MSFTGRALGPCARCLVSSPAVRPAGLPQFSAPQSIRHAATIAKPRGKKSAAASTVTTATTTPDDAVSTPKKKLSTKAAAATGTAKTTRRKKAETEEAVAATGTTATTTKKSTRAASTKSGGATSRKKKGETLAATAEEDVAAEPATATVGASSADSETVAAAPDTSAIASSSPQSQEPATPPPAPTSSTSRFAAPSVSVLKAAKSPIPNLAAAAAEPPAAGRTVPSGRSGNSRRLPPNSPSKVDTSSPEYRQAARGITTVLIAVPVFLVTSYFLLDRATYQVPGLEPLREVLRFGERPANIPAPPEKTETKGSVS